MRPVDAEVRRCRAVFALCNEDLVGIGGGHLLCCYRPEVYELASNRDVTPNVNEGVELHPDEERTLSGVKRQLQQEL